MKLAPRTAPHEPDGPELSPERYRAYVAALAAPELAEVLEYLDGVEFPDRWQTAAAEAERRGLPVPEHRRPADLPRATAAPEAGADTASPSAAGPQPGAAADAPSGAADAPAVPRLSAWRQLWLGVQLLVVLAALGGALYGGLRAVEYFWPAALAAESAEQGNDAQGRPDGPRRRGGPVRVRRGR